MQIATQLALFLDNQPGMLASVCEALHEANINIFGLTVSDTVDHSVIRLVVDNTRKALLLFEERGTLVVETEVLMLEADNKPGAMAKLAQKLADSEVNIEYCYATTPLKAKKGLLVLRVSDVHKALKVLQKD
jgi:hypothetical protein